MSPDDALREVCLLAHRLALASTRSPRDLIASLRVQLWCSAFAKTTGEDGFVDEAMWRLMRAIDADRRASDALRARGEELRYEARLRALLTSPGHGEQDEQRGPGRGI